MGFSYDAYVAYGVHIPVDPYRYDESGHLPSDQVDLALSVPTVKEACPDVRYLEAGQYDENMFFLVTRCEGAELRTYKRIESLAEEVDWDRQIKHLIEVMGWGGLVDVIDPGWFVVADCS